MSVITWEVGVAPAPRRTTPRRPAPRHPGAQRSGSASSAGLRLTRRGRLVVTALALALAAGFTFSAQNANAGGGQQATEVVAYTVGAGDTLWGIAGTIAEPGQDRRDVVDRIIAINGLAGGDLTAGQQLIIPAG